MKILQPNNPTRAERHLLQREALRGLHREEDFGSIIKLTSPPKDITTIAPPNSFRGVKVGILGGGAGGLSAAYELRKLGFDITILEGNKDRIGGRAYTYYFDDDLYGELGAMRIPVAHETTWYYINKFNLNTNPFIQSSENDIVYVQNVRVQGKDMDKEIMKYIYPKFDLAPWERETPLSKLIEYIYNYPVLNLNKDLRKYILKIKKNYPYEINYFDYLNLRKACEILGLSQGAINLLNSVLGIDRGLFYNSYLELLREDYAANFVNLYELQGGMYKLPLAFHDSLTTKNSNLGNVDFKKGCRVTGIYFNKDNDNINVRYLNKFTNKFMIDTFDYVVCAIPFSTLRLVDKYPLFSNRKMNAIREVNYSPSQKTIMLCNERFWERNIKGKTIIGGGSATDLPITNIWYPPRKYSNNYGVIIASYNIDLDATRIANLDDEYRVYEVKRELEKVHGLPRGYLDKVVVDWKTYNWNKADLFLGAFCMYNPEQNRIFSYESATPEYNNRLFFAGEHVSNLHAWVQGALQTGMIAANSIAKMCKVRNQ